MSSTICSFVPLFSCDLTKLSYYKSFATVAKIPNMWNLVENTTKQTGEKMEFIFAKDIN